MKPLFETFRLPAPAQTPLNEIRAPPLGPLRLPTGVWESLPPPNTGLDSAWGLLKSKSLARGARGGGGRRARPPEERAGRCAEDAGARGVRAVPLAELRYVPRLSGTRTWTKPLPSSRRRRRS